MSAGTRSVIVAGARTPIGRFQGSLSSFSAAELGGYAISAVLAQAGLDGASVDHVVMGQAIQAGAGQNAARQAAVRGGMPLTVPSISVNKVCLSGIAAVALADQLVRSGDCEVVVAGGMESMSSAPFLLPGARAGLRYGGASLSDSVVVDGLTDAFGAVGMGELTEQDTARAGITRAELDAYAAESHRKAAVAAGSGVFHDEIVPVTWHDRKLGERCVTADEGIRGDTSTELLGRLPAAFATDGLLTAGTSSPLSDGAAAVVVMSARRAEAMGLRPLAAICGYGAVAGPGTSLLHQPAQAVRHALDRAGAGLGDLGHVEINEAFASVAIQSTRDLRIDPGIVNPSGGALALGHPLGMSGARLVLTLAHALRHGPVRLGVAALCGGGGQGDAMVLRSV